MTEDGTESTELIVSGSKPDRSRGSSSGPAPTAKTTKLWLPLAIDYLPSGHLRSEALKWARTNIRRVAKTTLDGYEFTLYGRKTFRPW